MKKFVFIIFALFFPNVSWGAHVDPCNNKPTYDSQFLNDNPYMAFVYNKFDPTVSADIKASTISPTNVVIYPITPWLKKQKTLGILDRPYTRTLYNCDGTDFAFLGIDQCILSTGAILCANGDSESLQRYRLQDCDGEHINQELPNITVTKWEDRTKINDKFDSPKCPIIATTKQTKQNSKSKSVSVATSEQPSSDDNMSSCYPISGAVPNTQSKQYIGAYTSGTNSPAYLQCGDSAKDNAQCKDKDEVAGKDGYIYMCLNNAWEKIDDGHIERCNPSPDANAGRKDIIPEDENSPFVYEVVYYTGGTKIQKRCKYPRAEYEKYKNDTNNNGGRFLGFGVREKTDAQSSNLTSKSTIPYGKSGLTCNSTSSKNPNDCTINHVVSSSDGNVYKCTPNGWVILNNTDITLCQDNIEPLEKDHRFNGSNTWSIYDKKVETPEWIYFYESVSGTGCDPAIKIHCKYSTSKYKQEETECETQGGEFLTYGKNDDEDTFYKCYTNNVFEKSITVTDKNNNPLSGVTVIYRDIERTTNSAGQVTLPMVANRKEYDVTFKKDGFVDQTVREDALYSKPTIILNGSSNSSTTTEQPTITTNPGKNCTNTGGTGLDGNGNCICDASKFLVEDKYEGNYSICRCMNGYHREGEPDANGNYPASSKCVEAYEIKQVPNTMQWQKDTEDAYRNEYDNAQSWANKGVTGLSTLMTGEGAKMAAQAFAESRADKKAEEEMADYLAGMRCEYGNGNTLNIGNEDITLPGGNELANYYAEYKTLADKLKTTKAALNLRSGIEAEVLYDRAETGLYQYKIAEIQSGSTPSLSRALMDGESADATAWNAQKTATQNKLITGGVLAATGVVAGYAANQYVNRNHEKKYKDLTMTFTEIKEQIEQKYPEIFTPTTNPVEVVVIEEQPKNLETYAPEKTKVTINQKAKAGAFKSGGVTLTDTGKKGITDAINQYVTAIGEHTDINNIKITAVGHADPQQINSKNITKITNEYKTEMQNSIIPESERILKITKNDDLTKARAQVVISTLIDAIINTALPQNAKQARYDAQGTDGSDCTTTDKTEFEKCRYVDITIEFEGYKKTD